MAHALVRTLDRKIGVNDEVDFLEILGERMRAKGMNVSTAASAVDAIKMTGQEPYDVIVEKHAEERIKKIVTDSNQV